MKAKILSAIIILAGFIIVITSQIIVALDSPHNKIGTGTKICEGCHAEGLLRTLTSPFWGGSENAYDLVCQSCHTESSCGSEYVNGPSVKTHSRMTTSDKDSDCYKYGINCKYGNWTRECRDCHNPHYQGQKYYKSTDSNNLYLAKGTITSCEYYDPEDYEVTYFDPDLINTSILEYSSITYKTGTGWNVTKLIGKTETHIKKKGVRS